MIRAVIFALPLSACMHTPCPVPITCVTPDDCVCLVTGTVDAPRGGDGGQGYTPDAPDDGGDSGGGHSNGASSDANGDSSDSNGGNS